MTINIDAIVNVMAHIELSHLDAANLTLPRHDQSHWARSVNTDGEDSYKIDCGTSMCAAGWAVWLDESIMFDFDASMAGAYVQGGRPTPEAAWAIFGLPWLSRAEGREDHRWAMSNHWPAVFESENTVDDLYRLFAEWLPEHTEDDLRALVQHRQVEVFAERVRLAQSIREGAVAPL